MALGRQFKLLKQRYDQLSAKKKNLVHIGAALIIAIGAMLAQQSEEPKTVKDKRSLATFIPDGFVLVPISVENFESLDQILGQYGTVDLYTSQARNSERPKTPVARSIRLLRSPMTSNHFAVLAPESQASWLVQHREPFRVVIKSQHQPSGTKIDLPKVKLKRRKVVVEVGE